MWKKWGFGGNLSHREGSWSLGGGEGGRSAGTPEALRAGAADLEPKRGARTSSHQGAQLPAGAPTRAPPFPSGPRPLSTHPERPAPLLHCPGRPGRRSRLGARVCGRTACRRCPRRAERGGRGDGTVRLRGLCPPFSGPLPALSGAGEGGREGGEVTLFQRNRESPRDAPPRPPPPPGALPRRQFGHFRYAALWGPQLGDKRAEVLPWGRGDSLVRGGAQFKIRSSALVIGTVQETEQGLGKL